MNDSIIKAKAGKLEILLKAELSQKDKKIIFNGSKLLYIRNKIRL